MILKIISLGSSAVMKKTTEHEELCSRKKISAGAVIDDLVRNREVFAWCNKIN